MSFILKADPYQNRLLDDGVDELSTDLSSAAGLGLAEGESKLPFGRFMAKFVEDINNEMEQRDANLTDVDVRQDPRIPRLNGLILLGPRSLSMSTHADSLKIDSI